LEGSAGGRSVTGIEFARALGLRSTLFRARLDTGDGAAPAPPPGALIQVPPEETAAASSVVPFGQPESNAINPGAAEVVSSRAESARRRAPEGWALSWPQLLMGVALAVCLALRHYDGRPEELQETAAACSSHAILGASDQRRSR